MSSCCLVLPKQDRGAHLHKLGNLYESPGEKAMTIQKTNKRDNKRKKREGTDEGEHRRWTRPTRDKPNKRERGGGRKTKHTKNEGESGELEKQKTQECSQ